MSFHHSIIISITCPSQKIMTIFQIPFEVNVERDGVGSVSEPLSVKQSSDGASYVSDGESHVTQTQHIHNSQQEVKWKRTFNKNTGCNTSSLFFSLCIHPWRSRWLWLMMIKTITKPWKIMKTGYDHIFIVTWEPWWLQDEYWLIQTTTTIIITIIIFIIMIILIIIISLVMIIMITAMIMSTTTTSIMKIMILINAMMVYHETWLWWWFWWKLKLNVVLIQEYLCCCCWWCNRDFDLIEWRTHLKDEKVEYDKTRKKCPLVPLISFLYVSHSKTKIRNNKKLSVSFCLLVPNDFRNWLVSKHTCVPRVL